MTSTYLQAKKESVDLSKRGPIRTKKLCRKILSTGNASEKKKFGLANWLFNDRKLSFDAGSGKNGPDVTSRPVKIRDDADRGSKASKI